MPLYPVRICVYMGSSPGRLPVYEQTAAAFGRRLAECGLGMVYGGASIGLMGTVARAAQEAGGEVIGIIPQALVDLEIANRDLTDLRVVADMHARKALMAELADAFVALPGGIGTLEELFEAWTWGQLGIHPKPCGLLNVEGFYDALVRFTETLVEEQFLLPAHRDMLLVSADPDELLDMIRAYEPPTVSKVDPATARSEGEMGPAFGLRPPPGTAGGRDGRQEER